MSASKKSPDSGRRRVFFVHADFEIRLGARGRMSKGPRKVLNIVDLMQFLIRCAERRYADLRTRSTHIPPSEPCVGIGSLPIIIPEVVRAVSLT